MKKNLKNLTKRDLRNIHRWLNLQEEDKRAYCPFNKDCSKCEDIFPYYVADREYFSNRCPCGIYPAKYVTRIAKQVVNSKKGEKEMNIREALKELKEIIPNGFNWCLSVDLWKFAHSKSIDRDLKLWIGKPSLSHRGKFIYGTLNDIVLQVKALNFEEI